MLGSSDLERVAVRAEVKHMNGDRVDGYYYVQLTDGRDTFVLCQDRHPEFPLLFSETKEGKKEAQRVVRNFNRRNK